MTFDNSQMERDHRADQEAGHLLRTLEETCDELLGNRRFSHGGTHAQRLVDLRMWAAEERARLTRVWD